MRHVDKKMCYLQGSSFDGIDAWLEVAEIQISVYSQTSLKTSLCILGPDIFSEGLSLQIAYFDVWTPRILMGDISVSLFFQKEMRHQFSEGVTNSKFV